MGSGSIQPKRYIEETLGEPEGDPSTDLATNSVTGGGNDGGNKRSDFHVEYLGMPICMACSAHEAIAALVGKHGVHKFRCSYSTFGPAADAAIRAREDGFDVSVVDGPCPYQGV